MNHRHRFRTPAVRNVLPGSADFQKFTMPRPANIGPFVQIGEAG